MQNPSFKDLLSHPQLLKALESQGFEQPTPVQSQAIPAVLAKKNLLVSAQTGSGKTAAFLLPAIQQLLNSPPRNTLTTRVLVLTPTRELARQIVKITEQFCRFSALKVGVITGGDEMKYQRAMLRKNPEILVATPGRLVELISTKATDFSGLEILVLDEADRMLELGLNEDVLTISHACSAERQTLLFSATLEQRGLKHLIKQVLQDQPAEEISLEETNRIEQQIILADDDKHKEKLLLALLSQATFAKAVVFTNTKAKAAALDGFLRYGKYTVSALHGDMTQEQRKRSLDIFRQDRTRLLVATDVAARGLDIEGVDLIINFDMPQSGDEYTHRIGRTGRGDNGGRAVSLISALEWNLMSSIERYLRVSFARISLPGLIAAYEGPKKIKASGKAAGTKKKKVESKIITPAKIKVRARDKKSLGKRRSPSGAFHGVDVPIETVSSENSDRKKSSISKTPATKAGLGDGLAPVKRKMTTKLDLDDES